MKQSYSNQIYALWRKAVKNKDELKAKYYSERMNGCACASYETFIRSWTGEQWFKTLSDKE